MTVGELLDRCSARELAEWEAYFQLEAEEGASANGRQSMTTEADIMEAFRRLRGDNSHT
jgi:hypothetical protein